MNILILFKQTKSPFKRIGRAYLRMGQTGCDVIIIPYNMSVIESMSEKKFRRIYKKIYPVCKYSLVFSNIPKRLAGTLRSDGVKITDGSEINIKYIKEIILRAGSYSSSIGIYCERLNNRAAALIYRICEITSHLQVFTRDTDNVLINEITENALYKSGTPVNISRDMSGISGVDILVTADCINFSLPEHIRLVDICAENHRGIEGLYFSVPEKYNEIAMLCNTATDSCYAEFLEAMGADFSEIRIKGLKETSRS